MYISTQSLRHKYKGRGINSNLKDVIMIYPVTGWFEITKYDNKTATSIKNLVETTWVSG